MPRVDRFQAPRIEALAEVRSLDETLDNDCSDGRPSHRIICCIPSRRSGQFVKLVFSKEFQQLAIPAV